MSFIKNIWQNMLSPIKKLCASLYGEFWRRYKLAIITGVTSFVICLAFVVSFLSRSYAIGILKNQFEELEKNLQSMGYDYAYDELRFYTFSPWQIMRAKNFRIYSLDETDFWQWNIDEFDINVGIWNFEKVRFYLGHKQSIQIGTEEREIYLSESDIQLRLKYGKIKELLVFLDGLNIKNLVSVDNVQAQIKHQNTPFLYGKFDIKGIHIDDMTGWPMNKQIDHFYLYSSLQGFWDEDVLLSEAFYDWIERGGYLDVHKMILNWKPLIMVGNGDIRFNEKAEPTLSLNTASLALQETVDKLNENGFISNKGTFVVKLLLENKAVLQNPSDKYKTVVSPLKIGPEGISLENIHLR